MSDGRCLTSWHGVPCDQGCNNTSSAPDSVAFTDDDLKRLKEWQADGCILTNEEIKLEALLARLEAAELCARYLEAIHETNRAPVENEALIAWRKAAGKD